MGAINISSDAWRLQVSSASLAHGFAPLVLTLTKNISSAENFSHASPLSLSTTW